MEKLVPFHCEPFFNLKWLTQTSIEGELNGAVRTLVLTALFFSEYTPSWNVVYHWIRKNEEVQSGDFSPVPKGTRCSKADIPRSASGSVSFCNITPATTYNDRMAKKKTNAKWFMEQVENEQSGLKGFIRMLGVRPESVDDIAQEAFVIAYRKLTMFERGTNFGAWLRTIARNLVRNELRRQGRRRVLANDVAEFLLSRADEKSTHPSVEVEQAEQHEQRVSALRECLQKLPERSRRLVQQRYFEELSLGVIAADEETNANNVSQILFRLRAALSDCIQKQLGNIGA